MIKMIVPEPIDLKAVTRAIDAGLYDTGERVKSDMASATFEWVNETVWETRGPRSLQRMREWRYYTSSTPFLWVNDGTKRHPITAVGAPLLVYRKGYVARTTPGAMFSGGPGKAFGPIRSAKQVMHPGNKPRNFDGMSLEKNTPVLEALIQESLNHVRSL